MGVSEFLLAVALVIQLWGCWEHRRLAKRTGWMLPFILWTLITVGMAIPRVLSELISWGFFYRGFSLEVQMYTFTINSMLVVWAARSFSKHIDCWLDHIINLEDKIKEEPVKVEATVEVTVKEKVDVVP